MNESDNEVTQMWREHRRTQQARRAANRENGRAILTENSVSYEEKADGSGNHLVVRHAGKAIDYWPGTGKWIDRGQKGVHRRGIRELLHYVGIKA